MNWISIGLRGQKQWKFLDYERNVREAKREALMTIKIIAQGLAQGWCFKDICYIC